MRLQNKHLFFPNCTLPATTMRRKRNRIGFFLLLFSLVFFSSFFFRWSISTWLYQLQDYRLSFFFLSGFTHRPLAAVSMRLKFFIFVEALKFETTKYIDRNNLRRTPSCIAQSLGPSEWIGLVTTRIDWKSTCPWWALHNCSVSFEIID